MAIIRGSAQALTLKAYITADSELAAWYATGRMAEEVANALNQTAAPEFVVWKTAVDPDEIMRNGMDWTRVDNLTVGKADGKIVSFEEAEQYPLAHPRCVRSFGPVIDKMVA